MAMDTDPQIHQQSSAILKTLLFIVFVPGTVVVWLPWRLGILDWYLSRGILVHIVGTGSIFAGAVIALHSSFSFAWTGRGTPAPIDAPQRLVTVGFYRYCRNPMYWGVFFALVGEFMIWGTPLRVCIVYCAVFWTAVNLFIRLYEEPALTRKFGSQYQEYCRSVPRWLPRGNNHH